MAVIRGVLFRLCYQARGHRWNGWPVDYWLSFVLVLIAGLASLGAVPGDRATIYTVAAVVLVLWGLLLWAKRNQYVEFVPQETPEHAGPAAPLIPADKIEVRATGTFEVEGKEHQFCDLPAHYRTFATREHAVMAIVPPSRFLALGKRPEGEVGMWYIFFQPQQILDLSPGSLGHGLETRPALRVTYEEEAPKIVYLSFDDDTDRQRVWADLERSVPGTPERGQ